MRSKRALTIEQHLGIKDAVPNYQMVKANAGTIGASADGCRALSEFVNVFVGEHLWLELGPAGAIGCCSSMIYWNPRLILALWSQLQQQQWDAMPPIQEKLVALHEVLHAEFGSRGFTDTAYDRLGGLAGGFLQTSTNSRGPYPAVAEADVETLRAWYRDEFAEMLEL